MSRYQLYFIRDLQSQQWRPRVLAICSNIPIAIKVIGANIILFTFLVFSFLKIQSYLAFCYLIGSRYMWSTLSVRALALSLIKSIVASRSSYVDHCGTHFTIAIVIVLLDCPFSRSVCFQHNCLGRVIIFWSVCGLMCLCIFLIIVHTNVIDFYIRYEHICIHECMSNRLQ